MSVPYEHTGFEEAVILRSIVRKIHRTSWDTGQERAITLSEIEWDEAEQQMWRSLFLNAEQIPVVTPLFAPIVWSDDLPVDEKIIFLNEKLDEALTGNTPKAVARQCTEIHARMYRIIKARKSGQLVMDKETEGDFLHLANRLLHEGFGIEGDVPDPFTKDT